MQGRRKKNKNFKKDTWDSKAKELCQPGIRQKYIQTRKPRHSLAYDKREKNSMLGEIRNELSTTGYATKEIKGDCVPIHPGTVSSSESSDSSDDSQDETTMQH